MGVEGANLGARVRDGVLIVPIGYILKVPARRIIVANGLALAEPQVATQANCSGKWHSPSGEQQEIAIMKALRGIDSVLINEDEVKDNLLKLPLNEKRWKSDLTLALFGGKEKNEDRTEQARAYFTEQLKKAKKSIEFINLYLPAIAEADKIKAPIATQIYTGGLAVGFCLVGGRLLDGAGGVFGVSG